MEIRPDRLNSWLNEHHFSVPPVEYDLAASTGPVWSYKELLALCTPAQRERLFELDASYVHSAGGRELRRALAELADASPDQVIVTNGGSEALWILFLLAAEPGANVVVPPRPSYPLLNEAPQTLRLEVRNYHMPRADGFRVDVEEVRQLIDDNTKLVVINRPHNPTGVVVSDAHLDELHACAAERDVTFVVDEVLHPIYHEEGPSRPSASRLPGATVVGDFSKALCLSGLRLGWIVERDPRRAALYEQARSHFSVSGSPLSEAIALVALRRRDEIYRRARQVAGANLALLDGFLAAHADQFGWVRPRGGLTAFPWLRSGHSARDFCRAAVARGVLLAPGDCFEAPEHFRVGIGASGERFAEALERLDEVAQTPP